MEAINTFRTRPQDYFAPNNEKGASLPEQARGPVFQFYKDLDPAFGEIEVKQVTDQFRIVGENKDGDSIYYFEGGIKTFDRGTSIVAINDNLMTITKSGDSVRVGWGGNYLPLKSSPVMIPNPCVLNSDGKIGGCVITGGTEYARLWDETGELVHEEKRPNSKITALCPLGNLFALGYCGKDAALWINREIRILSGPNGEKAVGTHLNGSGQIGGSFTDSLGIQHACGWNSDGHLCELGLPLEDRDSYVIGLLVDGTYIVESPGDDSKNDYFIGRPGAMRAFNSTAIHTVEAFPLISIDGVSPTGVMVAKVKNPDLGRLASILIAPEAARRAAAEEE